MCGYVFFYDKNKEADLDIVQVLTEKIHHRGPDDTGYFFRDNVAFGFKRLSIIDLEFGKQPFQKDKKTIVYNGEIYNHDELRDELKSFGYSFNTNSDTEVLITAYLHYKDKCINHLRGMFSFVIYDEENKVIFGARDQFGIKPLYYIENDDYIAFSSEYKALVDLVKDIHLDENSLQRYLSFQYVPNYNTMSSQIKKVPNGTSFTIKDGKITFEKYYFINFVKEKHVEKKDIYDVVYDSVKRHMISNVEVGTFLSGGIDSTIIATIASKINPKIKSFSVGFGVDGYNELEVAKKTADALGIENIQINVTQEDYIKALPKVIYNMDDPLADPSCIGLYFLSKEAGKHVKVVLSGEGADELFAGYPIYSEYNSVKPFLYMPKSLNNIVSRVMGTMPEARGRNYLYRATTPLKERYIGNAKIFDNKEVNEIVYNFNDKNRYSKVLKYLYDECENNRYDYVSTMQSIDMHTWLEGDILLKGDKMSMASSIELRVPFLDKEVFEVAKNLDLCQKISRNNTKVLLRDAFKDIIPSHMVEKKKLGFPTPIRVWLKEDLGKFVRKTIIESKTDELINKKYAIKLLNDHIKGTADNSRKIWTIFTFCLWHQIFIEKLDVNSGAWDIVI